MTDLLELMAPEPKGTWRNGILLPAGRASLPAQEGDLEWLPKDYRDHRLGGRWYRYDASDCIYRCLDPYDQFDINHLPDTPPAVNKYGRLVQL